jgi:hypothetical protein
MALSKVVPNACIVPSVLLCLLAGMASGVSAMPAYVTITVDEILREQGQASDPSLGDLNPLVEMSFDSGSKLLTVILGNDASYVGDPDAGHLLTGLGFNLLPGVSIQDTPERDSSISLAAGSVIVDPDGTSGISLSQDDWGYANGPTGGHFVDPAQSSTNTVLSCMKADSAVTFAGHAASNALMGSFDYGLQGLEPTPGHSEKRSIRNAVVFSLYLDGPSGTNWDGLLSHVEDNAVVVSYGSPTGSAKVPEPATSAMCVALLAAFVVFRPRRRRAG